MAWKFMVQTAICLISFSRSIPISDPMITTAMCASGCGHVAAHHGVTPVFGASKSLSGLARQFSGLPVITNGKLHDPALAESALIDQEGDFVSIGKGALADPEWPMKVLGDKPPVAFHPDMISPLATLPNYYQWRETHLGESYDPPR
jgi:2,4-dienoyl-CoA reductase-like NADH-dependent reductase (Old Yellow Enzyme family)